MELSADNNKAVVIEGLMNGTGKCSKCAETYLIRQEDIYPLCVGCLDDWSDIIESIPEFVKLLETSDSTEEVIKDILDNCFRYDILTWCKAHGTRPSCQSSDYRERALAEMLKRFTDLDYYRATGGEGGNFSEDVQKYSLLDILTNELKLKEHFLRKSKQQQLRKHKGK